MTQELGSYHAARSIVHQSFRSACYAPFVGLSFDITGAVSVSAFTKATPLGRVGETSLSEHVARRADPSAPRCSRA